jgi:hypothetical protein
MRAYPHHHTRPIHKLPTAGSPAFPHVSVVPRRVGRWSGERAEAPQIQIPHGINEFANIQVILKFARERLSSVGGLWNRGRKLKAGLAGLGELA